MLRIFVRASFVAALGACAFCGGVNSYAAMQSADSHIVDVVAITQVFADGFKVSAVAVQYDKNISDASLQSSDFTVKTDVD